MQKKWISACILCISLLAFSAAAQKVEYAEEEVQQTLRQRNKKQNISCGYKRPINVAGFVTNPPFGWVDIKDVKFKDEPEYHNAGYMYDLFTEMADDLDLKVKNVGYASYQQALKDLRKGEIDVIVGTYYNKDILGIGVSLLTPSVMPNPIIPLFPKGREQKIESVKDLVGLRGVVRQEELIYPLIYKQLPKNVKLKQISGSKNAYKALINGEADYILTSLYSGEAEVRRFKLIDEIIFPTQALLKPEVFIAFSANTDCYKLKQLFAQKLETMQADKSAYMQRFTSYISSWGLRFANDPSLIDEVNAEKQ